MKIKKGDTIVYSFGFRLTEAKVIRVFDNHLKVVHKDFLWFIGLGMKDIIHKDVVLSTNSK